ncbi:HEAT repeat domain-containing protein [Methanofollis liminatans]|nr:HEAT repeat domain-containing protein [Methanofollis liminatans]
MPEAPESAHNGNYCPKTLTEESRPDKYENNLLFNVKCGDMNFNKISVDKLLEKLSSNDFNPEEDEIEIADKIAEFNDPRTTSQLIAIIKKKDDFYDALPPARALGKMKNVSIDSIKELLYDTDPKCRACGIFSLSFLQDEEFIPYLFSVLNDPNEHVRQSAISTLAGYGNWIIPLLEEHLRSADPKKRVSIIGIIGRIKDPESAKILLHLFLNDEYSEVSDEALIYFLSSQGQYAYSELLKSIQDLPTSKLAMILRYSGCVTNEWTINFLFDILIQYSEKELQENALNSIGQIGLPAIDVINHHLNSDNDKVKLCAIRALGEIGKSISSFFEFDLDDENLEELDNDDYLEAQKKIRPVIDSLIQLTRDSNIIISETARDSLIEYKLFYDDEIYSNILQSKSESGPIIEMIVEQYIKNYKIPNNILKLLWFKDGKYNLKVPKTEPSLIYSNHKIIMNPKIDPLESLEYYPTFKNLSPQQKYIYLNWLRDITKPVALGYVFIFYYGLERHLLFGNYECAVDTILQLIPHFDFVRKNNILQSLMVAAYYQNDIHIGTKLKGHPHQFNFNSLWDKSTLKHNLFYNPSIPDKYSNPELDKNAPIEDMILFFYEALKKSGCLSNSFDESIVNDKIIMTDPLKKNQKVELLIQKLMDRDPAVRRRAAYDLSEVDNPKKIEPLIKCLNDTNGSVREAAIRSLLTVKKGQSHEPLIIEPILERLFDKAKSVKGATVHYLGMSDDPKAICALKSALSRDDLRHGAARALAKKGISNPTIIQLLEEDSKEKWNDGQDAKDTLKRLSVVNAIKNAFLTSEKIDGMFIYGSFVFTYFNSSRELDLLIIGEPDPECIRNALKKAQDIIKIEINNILLSKDEFKQKMDDRDPLIEKILNEPKIAIIGHSSDLMI